MRLICPKCKCEREMVIKEEPASWEPKTMDEWEGPPKIVRIGEKKSTATCSVCGHIARRSW